MTKVSQYCANSLTGFMDIVAKISRLHNLSASQLEGTQTVTSIRPLWFRGVEQSGYKLLPSAFRECERQQLFAPGSYNAVRLAEDVRYQHFSAKTYHQISDRPEHLIEWQEIMQHHLLPTRLMDWSENSILALLFAMEAYITTENDLNWQNKRLLGSPCVWILNPAELNSKVYDCLSDEALIWQLVDDIMPNAKSSCSGQKLVFTISSLMKHKSVYGQLTQRNMMHIDSILSLSAIESMRRSAGDRLRNLLETGGFNPYYYLLSRVYIDGVVIKDKKLPPIAEIHPYHSERIRAQKGIFTVHPFHETYAVPMELLDDCSDVLFKIRITNPGQIARELLHAGYRRSTLYPEMEYVAKDIRSGDFRF